MLLDVCKSVCVCARVYVRAERACFCLCVCVRAHEREALQQQPPPDCRTGVLSIFRLGLSPPAVAPGPMRFLISAAMVMKACSTLVAFLALVSRNGMARESENSCKDIKRPFWLECKRLYIMYWIFYSIKQKGAIKTCSESESTQWERWSLC